MRALFFQFRHESDLRVQEYEQVLRFSGLEKKELISIYGSKVKPSFKYLDAVDGIVIGATGKGSITTEPAERLEPWMMFFREARRRHIPMIAFNYGAHLLALSFGGVVTRDENRKIIGSLVVRKTSQANDESLFASLPEQFVVQAGHIDRVETLPPGARCLLSSQEEENECWCISEDRIYAFECQLDLDQESLTKQLIDYQETYATAPGELEHYVLSLKPSPESTKILGLFFNKIVKHAPLSPA